MADVLAEFIIPFVVFGAFLERAGVAKFFVDISLASLGRIAGGPAQASVVSSLLMGTISGSPIAETVTKGPITIPLMKRAGFPPHIAAAVEAAASTGALIMPPVMGAGAFVMSEMTGIPYLEIIKVAAIPGILFFLSVGVMVYFESRKLGLRGLPAEELPRSREVWRRGWYLFLPIAVLIARDGLRLLAADGGVLRHYLHDRRQLVPQGNAHGTGADLAGAGGGGKAMPFCRGPRPEPSEFSSASCRSPGSSSVFRIFWSSSRATAYF